MEAQAVDMPRSNEIDLSAVAGRASAEVKLAHNVATMLQHEIISAGLTEGSSLGTTAEIRSRFGVGRWAVREGVGILELRGIAQLRRGRGGGVIVTEPGFDDLVNLTLLYLYASRSGPQEIGEARRAVLTATVKKLLDCSSASPGAHYPDAIDHISSLPRFLAAQTLNGAFELAVEFLESVMEACGSVQAGHGKWMIDGAGLWRSICHGDREAALSKLDGLLTSDERRMAETWSVLPDPSKQRTGATKMPHRLAIEILAALVEQPDRLGDFFGSETDIGVRFDANAEIVRHAIRIIEDLGVVAPRRGRYGGVMRRTPNAASIAALIPHLLAQKHVSVAKCFEAATFLSDEIVRLAASRIKDGGQPAGLSNVPEEATNHDLMTLDRQIQTYANNPLLLSIERGLGFYSCAVERPEFVPYSHDDQLLALSRRVLESVENGDVEGASAATRERFTFMAVHFAASGRGGGYPAETSSQSARSATMSPVLAPSR